MLLDKSGMRKRSGKEKLKEPEKPSGGFKQKRALTPEEAHDKAVQMALNYGIGYNEFKKEVDAIRAERIREKLEKAHKK